MSQRAPDQLRNILAEVEEDVSMRDGMEATMERVDDFESPMVAKLVGVSMNPRSRLHHEDRLDQWWASNRPPKEVGEIVIGSGLHAAIYCAVRVKEGNPKPLVIEMKDRAGGAFAVSREPSFYLNSRNRPGKGGTPGRDEALNFIPASLVQPADLSGEEYQPNTTLAFAIRATLAMYAKVITNYEVEQILNTGSGQYATGVRLYDESIIRAQRVIRATGLGRPLKPEVPTNKPLLNYYEFLSRLDKPFPFRGWKKVAVIGAGDSGRTVVEALLGQGPSHRMSAASLDWVDQIDWYGINGSETTREAWEQCNRSRYKGIGRALPRGGERFSLPGNRLVPFPQRAEMVECAYDGVLVDGSRYDAVIYCTGFKKDTGNGILEGAPYDLGTRSLARNLNTPNSFAIGPCASLPAAPRQNDIRLDVPENNVAAFRYADLTALFAASIPPLPPIKAKRPARKARRNVFIDDFLSDEFIEPKSRKRARRK